MAIAQARAYTHNILSTHIATLIHAYAFEIFFYSFIVVIIKSRLLNIMILSLIAQHVNMSTQCQLISINNNNKQIQSIADKNKIYIHDFQLCCVFFSFFLSFLLWSHRFYGTVIDFYERALSYANWLVEMMQCSRGFFLLCVYFVYNVGVMIVATEA